MSNAKVNVLFVCLGNICRSPLAECVFRHLAQSAGLAERVSVDSAGTSDYHEGDPPDTRATAVAQKRGIRLTGRSRPVTIADLQRFDYIVAMDRENLGALQRLARKTNPSAELRLLREFDPPAKEDLDVPDPYYGGPQGFELVHDIVERACAGLLAHIRAEHGF